MDTKRLLKVLLGVTLALAVLVVVTLKAVGDTRTTPSRAVGMGDLHRYEVQNYVPVTIGKISRGTSVGMGDLHRYEAQGYISLITSKVSRGTYVGMGDLHRYEYEQGLNTSGK